jgi:GTP-binding protein TypA/BipA
VLLERDADGELQEPIEEVVIDVDEAHSGIVVQKLSERKAEMTEMRPSGGGRVRLVFLAPTRGLIGYHGELLTDTRGTAVMNRLFHGYGAYRGEIVGRRNGVLISNDQGEAVAYALWNLEDRGPMMIEPGWKVYRGMIVGEHTRGNDLEVNVLKGKKLTNIRTHAKDEAVRLIPPIQMTLEKALAYIADDELVEVTPTAIRLRKKLTIRAPGGGSLAHWRRGPTDSSPRPPSLCNAHAPRQRFKPPPTGGNAHFAGAACRRCNIPLGREPVSIFRAGANAARRRSVAKPHQWPALLTRH